MIRLNPLTTTAIIIALASLTACASGPKRGGANDGGNQLSGAAAHPVGLYFVGHDLDRDGLTSRAELDAGLTQDWAKFTRNPSATQFQNWSLRAFGSSAAMPTFLSFDTNMNGSVTQSEFETRLIGEFNRLDRNGDGSLTRSELIFNIEPRRSTERNGRDQGSRGSEGRPSSGGRPPR